MAKRKNDLTMEEMGFTIIHNYPDGEEAFLKLQAKEIARVLENKLSAREINLLKEMVKNKSLDEQAKN